MEVVNLVFGSHLYGTSTPTSDRDFKSVHVPEARDIILNKVKQSRQINTKNTRETQVNGFISKNTAEDVDTEHLTLVNFFNLINNGDPMGLDMLFAPNSCIIKNSDLWSLIRVNKDRLISKNISRSMDYCYSQAAKYGIKGSRISECRELRDFFKNATEKHVSTKVRDLNDLIRTKIIGWQKTNIIDITQGDGTVLPHLEFCSKKISYNVSVKEAYSILDNIIQRFGERTRQAEMKEGVDWKGLSHAVRVGQQTLELLTTGFITFPRPNAEKLLEIKAGKLAYTEVAEIIESNVDQVNEAKHSSTLPDRIDGEWINNFIYEAYRDKIINDGR